MDSAAKEASRRTPSRDQAVEAVRTLISYIGDDPDRPGLRDTPSRVVKAWEQDWGLGYNPLFRERQVQSILRGNFDDGTANYDQMIIVRKIEFVSSCEHHLAPFSGKADIGYIPGKQGRVLGLSKLVRIVELYCHKLQVQERLTCQIADFLALECKARAVGVVMTATHSCMTSRGVKQHETEAITSALRGEMMTDPAVRAEFLKLISMHD